jgi:hypothetical protein
MAYSPRAGRTADAGFDVAPLALASAVRGIRPRMDVTGRIASACASALLFACSNGAAPRQPRVITLIDPNLPGTLEACSADAAPPATGRPMGTGTMTGTLGGVAAPVVQDVTVYIGSAELDIVFHDYGRACDYAAVAAAKANSASVSLSIQVLGEGPVSAFPTGVYLGGPAGGSTPTFDYGVGVGFAPAPCGSVSASAGSREFLRISSGGSLTITAIDSMHVVGRYDLQFTESFAIDAGGREEIAGEFDAVVCNSPIGASCCAP